MSLVRLTREAPNQILSKDEPGLLESLICVEKL